MFIVPDWPAPANVLAFSTTRFGGGSNGCYRGLNLGDHVGDQARAVQANRDLVTARLPANAKIQWLNQVHSTDVVTLPSAEPVPNADASITTANNQFCCVMTADCLPLLLCDSSGTRVAAVHAGWRGLCDGIIERTVAQLAPAGEPLLAWLGPAIGSNCFEVGAEVRQQFIDHNAAASSAFTPSATTDNKYLANIYLLARQRLHQAGVEQIYGGDLCTVSDPSRFYSYRRDGVTGRQATLIGLI